MYGSSMGSSSEVNSPVSFTTTENTQKKPKNSTELGKNPTKKEQWTNHTIVKGTLPPEAVASPEAYINYALLSPKQQKRTITQIMQKSTRKSINQGATVRRRMKTFTSPPGSGESSCQPSITAWKYPPIQGEKF
jgi:hypothetical protein